MKFTYNWLKDYLDTTATVEQISDKLNDIGLEIEGIKNPVDALQDFVVAEILSVENHPDADKLHLLKIFDGTNELKVVCGAPNVRVGLKGIVARKGVIIPDSGKKFEPAKIRGEESQAMMCSSRELCLSSDHNGIIDIPAEIKCKAGDNAAEVLSQIFNTDIVFDGEITPNRGDYLGVKGIAYDLQASGLGKLKKGFDEISEVKETFENPIKIEIKNDEACPMFATYYIKNVKNCESPKWLKDRLTSIGINPKSALVDITNYICFDMARPLHVFDADKLEGNKLTISIDSAGKLKALDEKEYQIEAGDIIISDSKEIVSIAGIMGGEKTGCSENTKNIILESALFDAIKIRKTASRLKINSDAKYRFERFIDPQTTIAGIKKAAKLIQEICGGDISKLSFQGKEPQSRFEINYPISEFKTLIGIDCPKATMIEILTNLGCEVKDNGDILNIITPSHRGPDLREIHDITEEIIRIYGYNKIPLINPKKKDSIKRGIPLAVKKSNSIRRILASRGLTEIISWEFSNDLKSKNMGFSGEISIKNPINSELNIMRESLFPNLIDAVAKNLSKGSRNISIFEVGSIFTSGVPGHENKNIAGVREGLNFEKSWNGESRELNVFDIKNDMLSVLSAYGLEEGKLNIIQEESALPTWLHPYRGALVKLGNKTIASFGQVHPNVLKTFGIKRTNLFAFEVLTKELPELKEKKTTQKPEVKLSDLQPIYKDLAFIVSKNIEAGALIKTVLKSDKKQIESVNIFDIFEGGILSGDKKSIAISVKINQGDNTLTDGNIADLISTISANVKKELDGELRDK